jgi:hypothetical protein
MLPETLLAFLNWKIFSVGKKTKVSYYCWKQANLHGYFSVNEVAERDGRQTDLRSVVEETVREEKRGVTRKE